MTNILTYYRLRWIAMVNYYIWDIIYFKI